MKKGITSQVILLLLVLLAVPSKANLANPNGITIDNVEIHSVSTRIDQLNYAPEGSVLGGTMIYLKATGFNYTPSKNKITIGPYNCVIPEKGISGNIITCETTPAIDINQRYALPVELHVEGKVQSKCVNPKGCAFTYSYDSTPYIRYVVPSAATPDSMINWNSIWRVSTSKDIKKMIVGDQNCNRFDIDSPGIKPLNLNDDTDLSKNSYQYLPCQLSSEQVAGLYEITAETVWGTPYKTSTLKQLTADGQKAYDVVITAEISGISTSSGGDNGNRLTIKGKGFGSKKESVQVSVEGIKCNLKSLSNNEIVCDLENGSTTAASVGKFTAGQGVQVTKYKLNAIGSLGDSGVYYPGQLKNKIVAGSLESERKTESIVGNYEATMEPKEGVHMRGYFRAPRSGEYKFWLSADDYAQVYLNTTPMTADLNSATLILDKCNYTGLRDYFSPNECGGRQQTGQTLEAGKYYWMEVFAVNGGGPGIVTVSVETPEDKAAKNKPWSNYLNELFSYEIKPEKVNQTWSVKMMKSDTNLYKFSFMYFDAGKRVTVGGETAAKKWNEWKDAEFISEIKKAANGYSPKLTISNDLDAAGNKIVCDSNDPTANCEKLVQGKQFIFEFQDFRSGEANNQPPKCSIRSGDCVVEKLAEQSTQVSGTYQVKLAGKQVEVWSKKLGGWTADIPVEFDSYDIFMGLRKFNEQFVNIEASDSGNLFSGKKFTFFMRSSDPALKGPVAASFEFDTSKLVGGKPGSKPAIEKSVKVAAENKPFYEPVPFDMAFVKADKPSVQVTVNNILSVCNDAKSQCSYEASAANTPVIQSFNADLSLNELTLVLKTNTKYEEKDMTITFADAECTNVQTSALNLPTSQTVKCNLNASQIAAGDHYPVLLLSEFGFAKIDNSVAKKEILPQITSLNVVEGSIQGGQIVKIAGKYFAGGNALEVKFGVENQVKKVISVNKNQEIVVELPELSKPQLKALVGSTLKVNVLVSVNKKSQAESVEFTYTKAGIPIVESLSLNSASPVVKQQLQITGKNFGSDVSKVSVWLLKRDTLEKVYELNILNTSSKPFSDTSMTVTLGGGRVGNYILRVFHTEKGYSMSATDSASLFDYVIKVTSVLPAKGNVNGGSLITVKGVNFSKILTDNTVYLTAGQFNAVCEIISASATEIVVRVPPQSAANPGPFNVLVQGRLQEDSICDGQCTFAYENMPAPSLDEAEVKKITELRAGEVLKIKGSKFVDSTLAFLQVKSMTTGQKIMEIQGSVSSSTEVTFNLPDTLPVGKHNFIVLMGANGYAGAFSSEVIYAFDSVFPNTAFSLFGTDLRLEGTGFDLTKTKNKQAFEVFVNGKACPILSQNAKQIICSAPAQETPGSYDVVLKRTTFQDLVCKKCAKYKAQDKSPILKATGPDASQASQVVNGNTAFSLTISDSSNLVNKKFKAFWVSETNASYRIEASSVLNLQATWNADKISGGIFNLQVLVEDEGYAGVASNNSQVLRRIRWNLPQFTIKSGSIASIAGGSTLTLAGQGLDQDLQSKNEVFVCGQLCEDIQVKSKSEITCTLPQITTAYVVDNAFGHSVTNRFQSQLLTSVLQGPQVQAKFDKLTSSKSPSENLLAASQASPSKYLDIKNSNSDECYLKISAFEGTRIWVDAWQLQLPEALHNVQELSNYFYDSILMEGSNDDVNWTLIEAFTPSTLIEAGAIAFGYRKPGEQRYHSKAYKHTRIVLKKSKTNESKKALCQVNSSIFGLVTKKKVHYLPTRTLTAVYS